MRERSFPRATSARNGVVLACLVASLGGTRVVSAQSDAPLLIPYVGTLERGGDPRPDADIPIEFALYDSADPGAAPLWTERQQVRVVAGRFSVVFGAVADNPLPADAFPPASGALFIGATVDGRPLAGRQRVLSVPFAINAAVSQLRSRVEQLEGTEARRALVEQERIRFSEELRFEYTNNARILEYVVPPGSPTWTFVPAVSGLYRIGTTLEHHSPQVLARVAVAGDGAVVAYQDARYNLVVNGSTVMVAPVTYVELRSGETYQVQIEVNARRNPLGTISMTTGQRFVAELIRTSGQVP